MSATVDTRTELVEELISRYPGVPPEAVLKEDLLRTGMAFDDAALTDNLDGAVKPKSYFIFSFDQKPLTELGAAATQRPPEEIALTGRARTSCGGRSSPSASTRPRRTASRAWTAACASRSTAASSPRSTLPPMPEYYRHTLSNGKTVMETAPTIEWGYLIYLTVLRLCQYFGAHEECGFCDINHNWRQHKKAGRPYTGVKPVEDVLEALELIDRHDEGATHAYTLTGGSVTSTVDGLAEADFYGRYAQAIEERFPGRWIGKVVAQALPKADAQRFKDYGISIYHPNYEVWDKRLFSLISPGQGALRRPRGVAPPDPRRGRGLRAAQRDPELRRRRRAGAAVRVRDDRRGDRLDRRGARLLHEPRRHAALHDLVPGADDAARPRQPGRRAARVPRAPARGLPRRARAARARAAAGLRRAGRRARRSSRSAPSWTSCERSDLRRRGADALARGVRRGAEAARAGGARRATTSRTARPTWSCGSSTTRTSASPSATTAPSTSSRTRTAATCSRARTCSPRSTSCSRSAATSSASTAASTRSLPLDYYCDLFASVRERYGERVEFYALTVAEFVFLADRARHLVRRGGRAAARRGRALDHRRRQRDPHRGLPRAAREVEVHRRRLLRGPARDRRGRPARRPRRW